MDRTPSEIALLSSFGSSVRRLRDHKGWTQARLAELVDVELRTVQKWESGEINPPLTTVVRIQGVFCCQWVELLGQPKSK